MRTHWETFGIGYRWKLINYRLAAGRLIRVKEFNGQVVLSICQRGTRNERDIAVDRVINCTGPGTANRVQDKLTLDLINRGLARFDPVSFGVDCDYDGSLISVSGEPSNLIYGIGPVCKGSLWETTAVAEIRLQAVQLAHTLLAYVEA